MKPVQRKMVIITTMGKKYSGFIDFPSETLRTTDLFNSRNIYWKNPNVKCYDDAIYMSDVQVSMDDNHVHKAFDSVQIKLSQIIYLYDDIKEIGDEIEKKRASVLRTQTDENTQKINIITTPVANSFYDIEGLFFGLFRKKSRDAFIPLTETRITEVCKNNSEWLRKEVELPHGFICVSSTHIESLSLD